MALNVRLPLQLEQRLAEYCVAHQVSKTEAVKAALDKLLTGTSPTPSAYELGRDGFGADAGPQGEIARNSKRLLREMLRAKARR